MVTTLVATVVSFHAPTINVTPNSVRSTSCSSSTTAMSRSRVNSNNSPSNSGSQQRRAAAEATATATLRDYSIATAPQRRRGCGVFELNAGGAAGGETEFYTPADLEAYSKPWGITLHYRSTLNTYRIEAHRPNGEVAGYTTGFYLGDLLHLDKVQVCLRLCLYLCLFVALGAGATCTDPHISHRTGTDTYTHTKHTHSSGVVTLLR